MLSGSSAIAHMQNASFLLMTLRYLTITAAFYASPFCIYKCIHTIFITNCPFSHFFSASSYYVDLIENNDHAIVWICGLETSSDG